MPAYIRNFITSVTRWFQRGAIMTDLEYLNRKKIPPNSPQGLEWVTAELKKHAVKTPPLVIRRRVTLQTHVPNVHQLLSTLAALRNIMQMHGPVPSSIATPPASKTRTMEEFFVHEDGENSVDVARITPSIVTRVELLLADMAQLEADNPSIHNYYLRKLDALYEDLFRVQYHILGTSLSQ